MAEHDDLVGLRAKREAAGLTQTELANRLAAMDPEGSWDQSKVSRYEMNEEAVPTGALLRMLRILGESAIIVERPELPGIDLGSPYSGVFGRISERVVAPSSCSMAWSKPLTDAARLVLRKPLVGVLGSYDSGKSTIINLLLGRAALPTSYQPQTFTVTYIHHQDDRPQGSMDEVFLMGTEFNPSAWRPGDVLPADDVLGSGSLELLVRRQDPDYSPSCAMVFLDAAILRSCSLVDSPGSLERFRQDEQSELAVPKVAQLDAAIVCSPVNGFMNADSLAHVIDALSLISHQTGSLFQRLLIVATHAHARVSETVLEQQIVAGGARRISDVLAEHAGGTGSAPSPEEISARMFAFDPEHAARARRLLSEMRRWLGSESVLAQEHKTEAVNAMDREMAALRAALDAYLVKLRAAAEAHSTGGSPSTPRDFSARVDESAGRLLSLVEEQRKASVAEALITGAGYDPETIERIIRNRFPEKKEAREGAALYILGLINREIEKDLRSRTERIQDELNAWMVALEASIPKFTTTGGDSTFSFRSRIFGAFAGASVGAAGATAVGAYAASLGNLGAYILVAKGVSALSAWGISVGGVAPAVSVVAAIGGPVTLGVAAIAVLALAGFSIVGGSWQKTLAKQIHKKLVKELLFPDPGRKDMSSSMPDALADYWHSIEAGIRRAASEAKAAQADLVASQPDVSDLAAHLSELEQTRAWLDGITFDDATAQIAS